MIKQRIIANFHHPRGLFGWIAGRIMATRDSNVQRNIWMANLLDPAPDAEILEIGHGPGIAIEHLWPKLTTGRVVGVEISQLMHRAATRRNRAAIAAGRVVLRVADSSALPHDLGPFDIIYGVNASMFWANPAAAITNLVDHLKPDGQLALTYMPPPTATQSAATVAAELAELLTEAGLVDISQDEMPLDPPAIATRGRRPSN